MAVEVTYHRKYALGCQDVSVGTGISVRGPLFLPLGAPQA